MLDFPNYYFENGKLRFVQVVGWDKDLTTVKGFYGNVQSATGAAGSGTYSYITIIKTFPYISAGGPTIDSVDAQGTVVVEVGGSTVSLAAGLILQLQIFK